jgi:hypothetical protein
LLAAVEAIPAGVTGPTGGARTLPRGGLVCPTAASAAAFAAAPANRDAWVAVTGRVEEALADALPS